MNLHVIPFFLSGKLTECLFRRTYAQISTYSKLCIIPYVSNFIS